MTDDISPAVRAFLDYPNPTRLYDTWFLTWPFGDDRYDSWVRVEATTHDEALAFVVKRYGTRWAELVADVNFNPDLYPDGELSAHRIEPS